MEDFLDTLSGKQAQKIMWVLRLIEQLTVVPGQYFKKLEGHGDIWEVRAQHGGDAFRLLGFIDRGTFVVLTNGFSKKTPNVPAREIELALQRKGDYLSRGDDERNRTVH